MKTTFVQGLCLLAFASLAAATNSVKFINKCPYPIYFWTVGPGGSKIPAEDHDRNEVPADSTVVHEMLNTEYLGGGMSIKIRDFPWYQVAPAGIIQVEYNLEPSRGAMWYDLSAIDCDRSVGPNHPLFCPLIGGGMSLYVPGTEEGACPPAWCANGHCVNTYEEHGSWYGEPSSMCWAGADIHVETCTHEVGPHTFQGQELTTSTDGTCARSTGYTCAGSIFGDCCSQYGFCGSSPDYCYTGCQGEYGICP
ncbi:hypothetical protein EJ02DRAFT_5010 [Clathrospora elynae]|uniref:Chitin-binding type-1 domain-containing protein n=1 Tax=Clathrospora elynae TaxID=706981 RepID=A0A6A5T5A5_9PLEO|nr:hypothetical protein EJ02DRAFT_5010 [Clathrospora elynae]